MKKLFLFTVALLASLMVGATSYTLEPGEKQIENKLSELVDGDVLELQTGQYIEPTYHLTFDKKITLRAAEGATPEVSFYEAQIANEFIAEGVKFKNYGKENYLLVASADITGKLSFENCSFEYDGTAIMINLSSKSIGELIFKNCMLSNLGSKSMISASGTLGYVTMDDCIFTGGTATTYAIFSGSDAPITNLTITNCTAYNCGGEGIYQAMIFQNVKNALVDHCTFYNCGKQILYIKGNPLTSCIVRNSVFASETQISDNCIKTYAGTVENCVYFNLSAPRDGNATVTNCTNANPLFINAAEGNLNWTSMSPLKGTATDGSNIGDPRWTETEIHKYVLEPGSKQIENILPSVVDGDTLVFKSGKYTESTFELKIQKKLYFIAAEDASPELCVYAMRLENEFEAQGIKFTNLAADNRLIRLGVNVEGSVIFNQCSFEHSGSADMVHLAEYGVSDLKFTNCTLINNGSERMIYSSGGAIGTLTIDGCSLTNQSDQSMIYASGSIDSLVVDNSIFNGGTATTAAIMFTQSTPIANLSITNSTFYSCGAEGCTNAIICEKLSQVLVDHCTFYDCGSAPLYLRTTTGSAIAIQNSAFMNTTSITGYCINIKVGTVDNCLYFNNNGPRKDESAVISSPINANPLFVDASAGNFNFSMFSPLCFAAMDGTHIGDPRWNMIIAEGVNLPTSLNKENVGAVSADMTYYGESEYFDFGPEADKENKSRWASWAVNVDARTYTVIADVEDVETGYKLQLEFINTTTGTTDATYTTGWKESNFGTLNLGDLTSGLYIVRLKNIEWGARVKVKNLTFTYAGGGVVTIPGTLKPEDAMLSEKAFIDNDTIFFAHRGSEGCTPEGWAKWNVTLEKDMLCSFRANCFKDNSMSIKISILDEDNNIIYDKIEKLSGSGDIEANLGDTILKAGNYVIQMEDTTMFSNGRLLSVVVEGSPVLVITDDSDIDFTAYANQTVNVQLIRTFKANMYNPICLPFGVSHSSLQSILKCETSYLLKSSSLEGQKLYVELEASQYNDIYHGSPYMIKPSEDVVNPLFTNVTIMETPHATSSEKGVLKLQGSFIKQTIDNPQTALLVGANNTLFFPNDETETPYIKSMRAYFELQNVEPSQMPKFACFREPGNAPTWMPIVGAETEKPNGKFIRDGRFVIVREGKEYNALGVEK